MPHDAIASLYASDDPEIRDAVARFIVCPGGRASDMAPADRCAVGNLERIQIDLVNWPGLTTSGLDTHFAVRTDAGPGRFSASWDSTYTVGYDTRTLLLEGTNFDTSQLDETLALAAGQALALTRRSAPDQRVEFHEPFQLTALLPLGQPHGLLPLAGSAPIA